MFKPNQDVLSGVEITLVMNVNKMNELKYCAIFPAECWDDEKWKKNEFQKNRWLIFVSPYLKYFELVD